MTVTEIVSAINKEHESITSVFFVGCGASMSELFPGKYFLEANSRKLRTGIFTANEFNYSPPIAVDESAIVVTCSLSGTTPETVAASKKAMELGATVISVTHVEDSPLAAASHYQIIHGFEKNYAAKMEKMANVLSLAAEILNTYEGYKHYNEMQDGFSKIYNLIETAASSSLAAAKLFANNYKDIPILYVMSSGATQMVSYSFASFLIMEMQWINASAFHDGEFFHGPFEIVDKDVPYLLLMNDGPTRAMDSRALTFLQRFDAKVTVVDAKDFALSSLIDKSVAEYFNPLLISGILRIYAEQLAEVRKHPLTKRRYMWKLDY